MSAKQNILPEGEHYCDCCKRAHRKLYQVGGYWLGTSCANHYEIYRKWGETNANNWIGYEKQLENIKRMIGATK